MPGKKRKGKGSARKVKLNQLRREEKYGQITMWRMRMEWEHLCKRITLPKLREDVVFTCNSFEKIMDTKDFIISLYMDEVRNQEERYLIAFKHNQDNIHRMMEMYFSALFSIHEENNRELQNMMQESLEFLDQQAQAAEMSENYIQLICFGLEMQKKRNDKQMKSDQFGEINELSTKYANDLNVLAYAMEDKLEDTWNHIRQIHNDYSRYIKENKDRYDAIIASDEATSSTIRKELSKLIGLQETLRKLTGRSNYLQATKGLTLSTLEFEKKSLKEYYVTFRNKLQRDRDRDAVGRSLITSGFIQAFDHLNEKLSQGTRMLEILRGCRRFETSAEKVLPFPFECSFETEQISQTSFLLFWQKVATMQTNRSALSEERRFLRAENAKLKRKIHDRCACLYCPVLPPIPTRVGRIPQTDGKDMIRKYNTQNRSRYV